MEDAPKPSGHYTIASRTISPTPTPTVPSSDLEGNVGQTFEAAERMVKDVVVHATPEAGRFRRSLRRCVYWTRTLPARMLEGRLLLVIRSRGLSTSNYCTYW